jgi:lycopene cyclase domain-containing protein
VTYFSFLLIFIVPPILALTALLALRQRSCRSHKSVYSYGSLALLAALLVVATLYTTPWDNHLIAQGVWSYNHDLVSNITLGYIPLEEFLFFPLQTLLVALWFFTLLSRLPVRTANLSGSRAMRLISVVIGCALWLFALLALLANAPPTIYLGWQLVWALPPILIQLGLGADILWQERSLLIAVIAPATLYLSAADAVALHVGIWAIDPHQSTGLLIGGALPLEEFIFFLLTTTLVAFGLTLGLAPASRTRLHCLLQRLHIVPSPNEAPF